VGGASGGPRVTRWAALAVACVVLVFHQARLQPWTLDDAFISMRYAWNLAHGHGLVFNPGEPVEGYTNFLWTVLLAPAALVGKDMVLWAKALGVLCTIGTLCLVAFADRWLPGMTARGATWSVLLLGTSGVFTRWSLSGMESPLVGVLVLAALLVHVRDARGVATGMMAAVAGLARPDANLVLVPILADAFASRRGAWARLAGFALVAVPYNAWRVWTYGDLFPNTFYVKVGGTVAALARGAFYANDFLGVEIGLVLLVAVGVFAGERLLAAGTRAFPLYLLAHLLYVVAVGGDVFQGFRFFSPVLPVLACCAGIAVTEARRGAAAGAVAIAIHGGTLLANDQLSQSGEISDVGERIGKWLRACAPPDAVLATNIAGAVPFYSRLETIDMLGLNDRHIAHREMPAMGEGKAGHEKGDGAYVLSKAPDYVVFGALKGSATPKFVGDRELEALPEFHEQYVLTKYSLEAVGNFRVWVRRPELGGKGLCDPGAADSGRRETAPDALVPFAEKRMQRQYDTGR
jgi:arabinofuranosyltransferase